MSAVADITSYMVDTGGSCAFLYQSPNPVLKGRAAATKKRADTWRGICSIHEQFNSASRYECMSWQRKDAMRAGAQELIQRCKYSHSSRLRVTHDLGYLLSMVPECKSFRSCLLVTGALTKMRRNVGEGKLGPSGPPCSRIVALTLSKG